MKMAEGIAAKQEGSPAAWANTARAKISQQGNGKVVIKSQNEWGWKRP